MSRLTTKQRRAAARRHQGYRRRDLSRALDGVLLAWVEPWQRLLIEHIRVFGRYRFRGITLR